MTWYLASCCCLAPTTPCFCYHVLFLSGYSSEMFAWSHSHFFSMNDFFYLDCFVHCIMCANSAISDHWLALAGIQSMILFYPQWEELHKVMKKEWRGIWGEWEMHGCLFGRERAIKVICFPKYIVIIYWWLHAKETRLWRVSNVELCLFCIKPSLRGIFITGPCQVQRSRW